MIREMSKKILICILIFIIIFNFTLASITFAADTQVTAQEIEDNHNSLLDGVIDGIAGIFTIIPQILIALFSGVLNIMTFAIASTAGTSSSNIFVTPFDIIFNKFTLTSINVFDDNVSNVMVKTIRTSVATWFGRVNAVAAVILLIEFLIIVAKLSVDGSPDKNAEMKEALVNWLLSMLLVVSMDFIVIFIVNINDSLVNAFVQAAQGDNLGDAVSKIQATSLDFDNHILGFGGAIAYLLLTIQTMKFLFQYIMRFFKVALLIIIAPLAPVPYAVNKMNNKQTEGTMENWLREFLEAVFVQIIHCIVYIFVVGVAFQGAATMGDVTGIAALAPIVFAICSLSFVGPAENMVRNILGIKKSGGGVRKVISDIASGTKNSSVAVSNVTSSIKNISGGLAAFGINLANARNSGKTEVPYNVRMNEIPAEVAGNPNMPIESTSSSSYTDESSMYEFDLSRTQDETILDNSSGEMTDAHERLESTISSFSYDDINTSSYDGLEYSTSTGVDEMSYSFDTSDEPDVVGGVITEETKQETNNETKNVLEGKLSDEDIQRLEQIFKDMTNEETQKVLSRIDELEKDQQDLVINMLRNDIATQLMGAVNIDELKDINDRLTERYKDTSLYEKVQLCYNSAVLNLGKRDIEHASKVGDLEAIEERIDNGDYDGHFIGNHELKKYAAQIKRAQNYENTKEMRRSLAQNMQTPEQKSELLKYVNRYRLAQGQQALSIEEADEEIIDAAISISENFGEGKVKSSDYQAALEKVKAEGKDSLDRYMAFKNNPSMETAANLTGAGKSLASIENVLMTMHTSADICGVQMPESDLKVKTNITASSDGIQSVVINLDALRNNFAGVGSDTQE